MLRRMLISLIALLALSGCLLAAGQDPAVDTARPAEWRAAAGGRRRAGTLHLIYLRGDAAAADVQYVRSTDGGQTFSEPLRVNSQPAIAHGHRHRARAHLALGRSGRVHVAWMGSATARPKGPGETTPLLYARQNDERDGFEPQRN